MSQRLPDVEERRRRRHRTLIYVILGTLPFYFCGIVLLVGFSGASSAPPETTEAVLTETATVTVTPSRTPGGPTLTLGATPTQFRPPTTSPTPTLNLDATATLRALLTQGANSLTSTAIARTQQVGGTATAQFQATATTFAQQTATANAIATATAAAQQTATANRPPNAEDDRATTQQNTPVTINVLANDSDPDGDSLQIVDVDETSNEGGSVECLTRGTCVYTPPQDFTGTDTFAYTVSDGRGGQDTALVDVRVTE